MKTLILLNFIMLSCYVIYDDLVKEKKEINKVQLTYKNGLKNKK